MQKVLQTTLPFPQLVTTEPVDDWTFNGAATREGTHCYHDYPARMIPQIAGKLLDQFGTHAKLLFDPYCGTGTSMVEAMMRGISTVGTDLNPLAGMIAKSKTTIITPRLIDKELALFYKFLMLPRRKGYARPPTEVAGITRLDFWFKPEVVEKLAYLRKYINSIKNVKVRLFFNVALSETVRECSNTRTEEFKLYRYDPKRLERFNPDVFAIVVQKLERNKKGLANFVAAMKQYKLLPRAKVCDFNTVDGIPSKILSRESVDIVITSPPYGDSHTTVAYGQYSRLSAAWLALNEPGKIDNALMGGTIYKNMPLFPCDSLNAALSKIAQEDKKRAMEVASFYTDLERSIMHIAPLICHGGYTCYVVGNRKVKGTVLPTDDAIKCFFEDQGFEYLTTFVRSIPNKRMPSKNSPTNAIGISDATMTQEFIVVTRRR